MNCCCRPPNYVRSVKLENKTDEEVTVNVTFKSEVKETYTLAANEEKDIERSISQGSYSTVDPVITVEAQAGDLLKIMTFNPSGVKRLTFQIKKESNALTMEEK